MIYKEGYKMNKLIFLITLSAVQLPQELILKLVGGS